MIIINLKDAGRYSNYLGGIIRSLSSLTYNDSYIYKIEERHDKAKHNKDALNEIIDVKQDKLVDCQMNDIAYLIFSLVQEKAALATAIEDAKANISIPWQENGKSLTIDAAIEYNKQLRSLASSLSTLGSYKNSESKKRGVDYVFNVEGNQTTYSYDIEVVKTLDYNKTAVIDLNKKILTMADTISTQIDEALLSDSVEFISRYSIHDTLQDVIEEYINARKGE